MKLFRSIFVLLGCLHLAVGQLNCLQIIAWANMIHDYSGERTLTEAVEMTMDGDHPCEMCLSIAEAKAQQSESPGNNAPAPSEERQNLRLDFQPLDNPQLSRATRWPEPKTSPPAGQALLPNATIWQSIPTPPPKSFA